MGIQKVDEPTLIKRIRYNDLIDFLGGNSADDQIDVTKILLVQGGAAISSWRKLGDLEKIDGAKISPGTVVVVIHSDTEPPSPFPGLIWVDTS